MAVTDTDMASTVATGPTGIVHVQVNKLHYSEYSLCGALKFKSCITCVVKLCMCLCN